MTRQRELQRLLNSQGYSLRKTRGAWADHSPYAVQTKDGGTGIMCIDLDHVEDVARRGLKKS